MTKGLRNLPIRPFFLSGLISIFISTPAFSIDTEATGYRISNGATVQINPSHSSACRDVTNNSGFDQFVSTKTTTEWSSFISNPPLNVTALNCGGGPPAGVVLETSVQGFSSAAATSLSTSSGLTTLYANELVLVFVKVASQTNVTISGGGLTWSRHDATGSWCDTSCVFYALAPSPLSNQTITATFGSSLRAGIIVSAYSGVDATGTNGANAIGHSSFIDSTFYYACNVSPCARNMKTTRDGSLMISLTLGNGAAETPTVSAAETLVRHGSIDTIQNLGLAKLNSTTATLGTDVTSTWTYSASVTFISVMQIEILGPAPAPVSTPTIDQISTVAYVDGSANNSLPALSVTGGVLLLLAVTTKTNDPSSAPSGGPGGWTSIARVSQASGLTTEVFRAWATNKMNGEPIGFDIGTSLKATALLVSIRGVNTSGTNGSGAIDISSTGNNTTANPNLSLTTGANDTLVLGFLGNGNATQPTAGTNTTRLGTISSPAGGSAATKATTTLSSYNTLRTSGQSTSIPFTLSAIDWAGVAVSVKP